VIHVLGISGLVVALASKVMIEYPVIFRADRKNRLVHTEGVRAQIVMLCDSWLIAFLIDAKRICGLEVTRRTS
jgi:hypothetical protein